MKIKVTLSRTNQNKEIDIQKGKRIIDLLKILDIKPDTVIVMENNQPLPITNILNNSQELTILQVSSGG